jgi:hypothetical protein
LQLINFQFVSSFAVARLNFMQPACPVKRPAHVGRMLGDAFVAVVQVFSR